MSGSLRTFLRTSLLVVAPTLALCVAMLEVGLRLQGHRPSNVTSGIFQKFGKTYRLRPSMTKLDRTPSYSCTIETNSFGLRDRTAGARTLGSAPYFAFVGDSITFGNGVDYDDSFVGAFARAAALRGYDVLNLAVGGHRFSDQELLLRDFLAAAPKAPSWVVVVFTKDFITGFERDSSGLIVKNGYLFSRDHWWLPYLTVTLGDTSTAYDFFRDSLRHIQGRVRPAKGAALDFLDDFSRTGRWAQPATLDSFEARLDALDDLIRAAGAKPIYVYMPVSRDLDADRYLEMAGERAEHFDFHRFHDLLARHAGRSGIGLLDVTPVLQAMHATGQPMTFMQDPHYNAAANRVIAGALAAALLQAAGGATAATR